MSTLLLEAASVGATLAFALVAAFSIVKPTSTIKTLLIGFIVGVLIHLGFELAGLNKYYCSAGHACRP